jgi:hypothetical protein
MSGQDYDDYRGDVFYDVWRSGGNPDAVDYDRVRDSYYDGLDSEDAARRELHAQRPPEPQMTEEEYYAQQEEAEGEEPTP